MHAFFLRESGREKPPHRDQNFIVVNRRDRDAASVKTLVQNYPQPNATKETLLIYHGATLPAWQRP
ncbi:MAG TPA: hypothetical protein VHC91_24200 [Trinickia sp.]|uniref:hypothetical protein n=1 Tax=Trinickia sp. TaxID=2571163 RepID=UPI002CC2F228|nr:hypothetical protein [Trinickia sp.]HVW53472.1 hypothetical protein [Trinickia sp.]